MTMRAMQGATLPGIGTVVLADNERAPLVKLDGIGTLAILEWIAGGASSCAAWGITPQVNSWLTDLPPAARLDACSSILTHWEGWRILFVPGKFLEVRKGRKLWRVFDCSGFWNGATTLPDAATRWSLDGAQLPLIGTGDAAEREEWKGRSLDDLTEWCVVRAHTIGSLMARVTGALARHDLLPSRLHGVGAIGSRLVREADGNHWIARYRPDRQPEVGGTELLPIFMRAYYGGRQETTAAGSWTAPTFRYDMRSAYPWALSWLGPVGYVWEERDTWTGDVAERMSVWYVQWRLDWGQLGPFPWRHPSGSIAYPLQGQGWYWWPEVAAALRAYGPGAIRVVRGYVSPRSRRRPMLEMVAQRYSQRAALEAAHDPTADILKGALASVYGRMAQRMGAGGHPGRWYNPALAGWVCSAVRGRLIDAWAGHEGMVASVSTDGFLTSMKLPTVKRSKGLGGWKLDAWSGGTLVLPGVYQLRRELPNGNTLVQTASAGVRNLDFDRLIRQLDTTGKAKFPTRWFAPHILADMFPDAWEEKRCRWVSSTVTIDPYRIARKRHGAEQVRDIRWKSDLVSFQPYDRIGTQDSHASFGPPAWEPGGADLHREALHYASKGS